MYIMNIYLSVHGRDHVREFQRAGPLHRGAGRALPGGFLAAETGGGPDTDRGRHRLRGRRDSRDPRG